MVAKINRLVYLLVPVILFARILFFPTLSLARGNDLVLISDAETQNYLAAIVKPLFQAAGIHFDKNKLLIVNDNSLNAFVSDGNYMFVHTGTLLKAENTNEIAGILAHETGHIMGGHIVRQKLKLEKMQYVMLGSVLAAGAAAVTTGRGDAAMAVILGSQSSAISHLLHHQVQEERSADESAVKLLAKTQQSTQGLLNFMQKIKKTTALSGIAESDYFNTHPLTAERISHFRQASASNHFPTTNKLDASLALIQAKLSGFLEPPSQVLRRYPQHNKSLAAKYAHSILAFRQGQIDKALRLIDELIKEQPQNPYFYEQQGQFLFESGKVRQSISAYQKALRLLPDTPAIQLSLAHSIIESSPATTEIRQAVTLLKSSLLRQPNALGWQLLAQAYGMQNKTADSYYATAEFNYLIGNLEVAKNHLEQAKKQTKDQSLLLKISDLDMRLKEELK